MPIRTPPQHNTAHPPGQISQPFYTEKLDWSKTDMGYKSHPKTLGDVIDNVMFRERAPVKKLTFEEWATKENIKMEELPDLYKDLAWCWKEAQENK